MSQTAAKSRFVADYYTALSLMWTITALTLLIGLVSQFELFTQGAIFQGAAALLLSILQPWLSNGGGRS